MAKKSGGKIALIIILGVVGFCLVAGGAGAAVGWTSFQRYIARSKTAEASSNLRTMFTAASAYYANESWGGGVGGGAPAQTACTVGPAMTSNAPSSAKTLIDWTQEPDSFEAIGFRVADPVYYQYEIAGGPGRCGHAIDQPIYTLRAHGDLDGDGERSLFELTVRSDVNNSLERSPLLRQSEEE